MLTGHRLNLLMIMAFLSSQASFAEQKEDEEILNLKIETLAANQNPSSSENESIEEEEADGAPMVEENQLPNEEKISEKVSEIKIEGENLAPVSDSELSAFGRLGAFSDIAVLQRRFLPKTKRFELSAAGGAIFDNPFFVNVTLGLRFGFYFTEKYGVEANYHLATDLQSPVVDDLYKRGVKVSQSLTIPRRYYGLDFKWNPVYGKLAVWNRSIVPFDNYYLLGLGQVLTLANQSISALHMAVGFMFAHSKSWAFRPEVSFYTYSIAGEATVDIHLILAMSFFFPEAKYR